MDQVKVCTVQYNKSRVGLGWVRQELQVRGMMCDGLEAETRLNQVTSGIREKNNNNAYQGSERVGESLGSYITSA